MGREAKISSSSLEVERKAGDKNVDILSIADPWDINKQLYVGEEFTFQVSYKE